MKKVLYVMHYEESPINNVLIMMHNEENDIKGVPFYDTLWRKSY